jgi:hypothetical protein
MTSNDKQGYGLLLFVAVAFLVIGFLGFHVYARQNLVVAARQKTITGHFTAHVGNGRSSRVIYAYTVNGVQFKKRESCWNWLVPCPIGQAVTVYYDPANPQTCLLMDFRREAQMSRRLGLIATIFGVALSLLVWLLIMRARRRCIQAESQIRPSL